MRKHMIRDRRSRYGGVAIALTVLVIAVTVLANAVFDTLAKRYYWYTYMLADVSYGVTDTCFDLLEEVFDENPDAKAEIIFCDLEENLVADQTMSLLHQTASEMVERFPDHLTMNCYDIWTDPTKVKNYLTTVDPTTGETIGAAFELPRFTVFSRDYGCQFCCISKAPLHGKQTAFLGVDTVSQGCEAAGFGIKVGNGSNAGNTLAQIDAQFWSAFSHVRGKAQGGGSAAPANGHFNEAAAALQGIADVIGTIDLDLIDL